MVLRSKSWGLVWIVGGLGLHCEGSTRSEMGDAGASVSNDASAAPTSDIDSSAGGEEQSSAGTSSRGNDETQAAASSDERRSETTGAASAEAGVSDTRLTSGQSDETTDGASSGQPTFGTSDSTVSTEKPATDAITDASATTTDTAALDGTSTDPTTSPSVTSDTSDETSSANGGEDSTGAVECDWGSWFDSTASACVPVTSCPPGQFMVTDATPTSDRVCDVCPDGTYTPWSNWTSCVAWSTCEAGQRFVQAGDAAHDVVCEYCLAGTYSPGGETTECAACPAGTTSFNGDGCCFPVVDSPSGAGSADAGGDVAPSSAEDGGVSDGVCSDPVSVLPLPACGDLVVDAAGDLYLADHGEGTSVTKLRPNGETIWQWVDDRSATLRHGRDGQLYLLDMEGTRLSVALLSPDGQEQHLWTAEELPKFHDVNIGADGAFYMIGSLDLETGGTVGHVTRLDAMGNWQWTVELTPPYWYFVWGWFSTWPTHMALDADGGVYVLSSLQTPFGDSLGLELTKLNSSGQVSWLEAIPVPEFSSGPSGLVTTNDAVVLGYDYTQSFFVGSKLQHTADTGSYSFDGEPRPSGGSFYANIEVPSDGYEEFRANSWITELAAGSDGTWAVIGTTDGYFDAPSAGGVDWFLGVFSPNGDVVRRQFGSAGDDYACGAAVDGEGNVFVVGQAPEGVSFAGLPAGSAYLLRYPASTPQ